MTWREELVLDHLGPPVQMGVRKLNSRSWLLRDEKEQEELLLKRSLRGDPTKEVFLSRENTEEASENVISLVHSEGRLVVEGEMHPLDRAGLSVQEDLCLLHRTEETWVLKAASLCFPSRWKLREKIGKGITAVHGPVEGYPEFLERKVTSFLDRLGPDPTWRRNWFIHPDDTLYQPNRPDGGDPVIASSDIGEKLFVRSERQTLRTLDIPDWILFTIRVQQTPLKHLIEERRDEFTNWITNAPESHHRHKGLRIEQVNEIIKVLC
tara:strand:- start:657 stop:1454 length:798 start_codon:yes stop_codon:yes gene_type:complete